jgi:hypothetical protein
MLVAYHELFTPERRFMQASCTVVCLNATAVFAGRTLRD